ncbi:hypothetical protein ACFQ07_20400 [Actinomadura adrarensis]|uniref:Uncharacterized protein n=1 Tax=Actinomadura adrarensis TaxID=1819600 RepID=A0ABW3CL10_9ACTN
MAEPLPSNDNEEYLVELDDQQRADLSLVADHAAYHTHREPDGTIVMRPEPTTEEIQAWIGSRPDILESIEESRAHPERSRSRPERNR